MNQQFINDFSVLFDFVISKNQKGGAQSYWNGIVAGHCTRYTRFIQADGVSAVLDTQTNNLRFNQGSALKLSQILAAQQQPLKNQGYQPSL